jgi:hypothetical protein
MMMGDSTLLFRKAYRSPEGKGFSSIGGRVGTSNSGSSKTSLESSSSWMKFSVSHSRVDSGESNGDAANTSSIGSISGEIYVKEFFDRVIRIERDSFPSLMLRLRDFRASRRSFSMG